MLQVSQLFIYPVKSLGGIAVSQSKLTDRGLAYDRRWMLIDENNRFLSQREYAQLALFTTEICPNSIKVTNKTDSSSIHIPLKPVKIITLQVTIWDDTCTAQYVSDETDKWFSNKLGINCRLVYMPDNSKRPTDTRYTPSGTVSSFSDAYPILVISQASLDDLNSRLDDKLTMERFRPNIVFTGGEAYSEDGMHQININGVNLYGVKLCARCIMTTIDPVTAQKSKEPLKTLAIYRRKENKILFGQNLISETQGVIHIGDELKVISLQTEDRFVVGV